MSDYEEDDWFATGYDEYDELPDGYPDDRLYLKTGEEALLILLDGGMDDRAMFNRRYGAPFCIWEYQIPTADPEDPNPEDPEINWRNWVTGVRGRKNAQGEELRDFVREKAPDLKPSYVGFYTAVLIPKDVNLDDYISSGEPLPESCRRILVPAKRTLLGILKRHHKKHEGLRACVYNSFRGSSDAASTGDDWTFDDKLSEDVLKKLLPDGRDLPLEYPKLLAPKSEAEIEGLLKLRTKPGRYRDRGRGRGRGRDDSGRGRGREDDRRGRGRGRDDYDRGRGRGRGRGRDDYDDNDYDRGGGRRGGRRDMDDDVPF